MQVAVEVAVRGRMAEFYGQVLLEEETVCGTDEEEEGGVPVETEQDY